MSIKRKKEKGKRRKTGKGKGKRRALESSFPVLPSSTNCRPDDINHLFILGSLQGRIVEQASNQVRVLFSSELELLIPFILNSDLTDLPGWRSNCES